MALNPRISDWAGKSVWVIGASSGIGQATASLLHSLGACVWVSARQAKPLQTWVNAHPGVDAQGRSMAHALPLDVMDAQAVHQAARQVLAHGPLDMVLYCAGHYLPQRATALNVAELQKHHAINVQGVWFVLDAVLPAMLARGAQSAGSAGHISVVSSVAGFRGLPQSLAYGPTKAALINLAETLYLDLHPQGIGVSVVNPGFVQTPLTAQNDFAMPALISPEQAAQAMVQGWAQGAFDIHFPKRFTRVMKLLRLLPYRLYFPLVRKMTHL